MNHHTRFFTGLLVLATATGCIQSYDEFTLNPDGSGKVLHRTSVLPMDFGGGGDGTPEDKAKNAIKSMVNDSQGVDAWRDVTYQVKADGAIQVEGVAYFPDIQALQLASAGMQVDEDDLQVTVESDRIIVQLGNPPSPLDPDALSDAQVAAKVKESRQEYNQSKAMMSGFLATLRVERIFHLPGTPASVQVFEQQDDGSIRNLLEGKQMVAALDELMADDAYLREQALRGASPGEGSAFGDAHLMEKLFGTTDLPRAVYTHAGDPLFDYATEVAEATAGQEAMLAALGITAPVIARPAAGGGGFTALEVAGIQWIRIADSDNGIHPFNSFEPGYKISVIGTLPGAVLDVTEGAVSEARDDQGNDLLPEEAWDRRLDFPSLSTSKDRAVFSIDLKSPSPSATSLAVVAGTLEYLVAGPTRKVDLGIGRFAAGASGSEFGATITKIGKSDWDDDIVLSLKLDLPSASVDSVTFRNAAGQDLEAEQRGTMMMNDVTTIDFAVEGDWPETGSITVDTFTDMKAYQAEFRLEDIDLLGRPLK